MVNVVNIIFFYEEWYKIFVKQGHSIIKENIVFSLT